MERLTMTDSEMDEIRQYAGNFDCPIKAEDDSTTQNFCDRVCDEFQKDCPFAKVGLKLKAYEDAEENGLLIHLPCRVGDTVYILAGCFGTFYEEDICDGFYVGRDGVLQVKVLNNKGNHGTYGVMGKTVFLTREEAEQTLKQMGE